ncbi:alpha/beta fold hydrolase [Fulvimarina sp. MAC8]|uniref:thioesterase II family protein n=1 Tax=Fulvimarina sp. MAC8 TaxID=3162874 RepID=UPI0032F02500
MTTRPVLLALPPAGIGPAMFRPWQKAVRDFDVHAVSLPGREARFSEPPAQDIGELADRLSRELEGYAHSRYAVFGYSMGALLGYEIALRWQSQGLRPPEHFFILGCNAPDRMVLDREPLHTMGYREFIRALHELGGLHPEIVANEEAMALFEPGLRNDFRLCETYRPDESRPRLACSVDAYVAMDDHFVNCDAASAWSLFVTGTVSTHSIEGRHILDEKALSAIPDLIAKHWPGNRTGGHQKSPAPLLKSGAGFG